MYRFLVAIVAALIVTGAFRRLRKKQITLRMFVAWSLLWVGVAVISFVPQVSDRLTHLLGIGRGVDLLFFISILSLMYLIFYLYVRLERTEREMTELVRALALRDLEKRESENEAASPGRSQQPGRD